MGKPEAQRAIADGADPKKVAAAFLAPSAVSPALTQKLAGYGLTLGAPQGAAPPPQTVGSDPDAIDWSRTPEISTQDPFTRQMYRKTQGQLPEERDFEKAGPGKMRSAIDRATGQDWRKRAAESQASGRKPAQGGGGEEVEYVDEPQGEPARGGYGGGGAPTMVPATELPRISPARIGRIEQAYGQIPATYGQERAALGQQADAEGDAAKAQGDELRRQSFALEGHGIDQEAAANAKAKALAKMSDDVDAYSKKVSLEKIDPDRYWKNKDVGQKILYVIAAALSGASGGRGPNVLGMGMEMMKADIDAQAHDIETHKGRIGDMKGVVADAYKRFGDLDSARETAWLSSVEKMKVDLAAMAAEHASPTVQARAAQQMALLDRAAAEARAKIEEGNASRYQFVPEHPLAMGGGAPEAQDRVDIDPKLLFETDRDSFGAARSAEDAQKIRDRQSYERNMGQLQDQAAEVFRKYGRGVLIPGTDGYKQLNAIKEQAIPIQSMATGQGVVREYERDPTLAGIGLNYGVGDVLTGRTPEENLELARKSMGGGSRAMISAQGSPGQFREVWVRKPNGSLKKEVVMVSPEEAAPRGRSVTVGKRIGR